MTATTPNSVLNMTSSTRVRLLLAIGLTTLATLLWTLFVHAADGNSPPSLAGIEGLSFNPYLWGAAVQEFIVPLILLFLFSRTALFKRVVALGRIEDISQADSYKLLLALILCQIVYFLYEYWLIVTFSQQVTFGLIIVFVAGLMGGWRVGLGVGIVALLTTGWIDYQAWDPNPFEFSVYFDYFVLKYLPGIVAVWLGTAVGLAAQLLRERRYHPPITLGLNVGAELIVFIFLFIESSIGEYLWELLLPNLIISSLAALAFVMMVRAVQSVEMVREAEAAQLALAQTNLTLTKTRLALAEAELRALHAQINPHFFFNSLNTIRYFIRTNPEQARELLLNLSEIFQRALSAGEFVPLSAEISHVEAYLALEKARLEDNLQVIWTNLAKDRLATAVPTLVLQPIVENAVIHGIATQADGGTLHIVINKVGADLLFQVDDNGPGFDTNNLVGYLSGDHDELVPEKADLPPRQRSSIGLRNVNDRLRMLYGPEYGLLIESENGRGTRVIFRVPVGDRSTD